MKRKSAWLIILLLVLIAGCSLKIDIDPSKMGRSETQESME